MNRSRSFKSRLENGERGAVATLVAVLLMGGVVMGMLALTVDVGNALAERRQLQNGADATSLALAADCAEGRAACTSPNLTPLANSNAEDARSDVKSICYHGVGGASPECTLAGDFKQLPACTPKPDWLMGDSDIPYVETVTRTRSADGTTTILPKYFSRALVGGGPDVTVEACARAAWGPPAATGPTLPVTMGLCDWMNKTANGTKYAPGPPYSPGPNASPLANVPDAVLPYVLGIFTHDSKDHKCSGSPGQEYPGGFAWLDPEGDCVADIADDSTVPGDTGANTPTSCKELLKSYLGHEVMIPIFDTVSGTGSGAEFHVNGVASFYFAGYKNAPAADPKSSAIYAEPSTVCTDPCNPSVTYVWGWFTSGLQDPGVGGIGSGPSRGVTVVVPAG